MTESIISFEIAPRRDVDTDPMRFLAVEDG